VLWLAAAVAVMGAGLITVANLGDGTTKQVSGSAPAARSVRWLGRQCRAQ